MTFASVFQPINLQVINLNVSKEEINLLKAVLQSVDQLLVPVT